MLTGLKWWENNLLWGWDNKVNLEAKNPCGAPEFLGTQLDNPCSRKAVNLNVDMFVQ